MTATQTAICQHPECDNEYVPRSWMTTGYCSAPCGRDAAKRKLGMRIAIEPNETTSARKAPMTDEEKDLLLAGQPMPGRRSEMRELMVRKLQARRAV